jgi:hypothetical protein
MHSSAARARWIPGKKKPHPAKKSKKRQTPLLRRKSSPPPVLPTFFSISRRKNKASGNLILEYNPVSG